jgi:hypothetical protein
MSACPHVELAIAAGNNVIARPVVALALLGATKELGTTKRELGTAKELVYQHSLAAVIDVAPESPASAPKPRLSVAPPTRRVRRTAQPARHAACCWVHKCALSRRRVPRGGPLGSGGRAWGTGPLSTGLGDEESDEQTDGRGDGGGEQRSFLAHGHCGPCLLRRRDHDHPGPHRHRRDSKPLHTRDRLA